MTVYGRELEFCIDMGSSLSLIADSALREFFPDIMVSTIAEGQSVKLTGIGDKGLVTNYFVNLPITMKTLDRGTVQIVGKTYVVDQLSCNMLIGNNILRTNHMDISWACLEAGGKDVIRIGTAYIPIQAIAIQKS